MRRAGLMRVWAGLAAAAFLVLSLAAFWARSRFHDMPDLVELPGGWARVGSLEGRPDEQPREVWLAPFRMNAREIAVDDYARYLNEAQPRPFFESPQIERAKGRYRAAPGRGREAVAYVTHDQALAYARWLSDRHDRMFRLPTEDEWEYAARGGLRGARFPWGWVEAEHAACFDRPTPCATGQFPPNGYGLYDMAGGVYEWCAGITDGQAPARGGSWAEKEWTLLRVERRTRFPADYRDGDVGFRLVEDAR